MTALFTFILVFTPMLIEAALASRNERRLRAARAYEPPGDVYRVMRVAYPSCFLAMIAEGSMRGVATGRVFAVGLAVFVGAKALKYWTIRTLGARWTFRVLVPRQSVPIASGPYRYLRHPNYAGVVGELAGVALMASAPVSGTAAVGLFAALILVRVGVENRALAAHAAGSHDDRDA